MTRRNAFVAAPAALLGDIRALIEASHQRAASAVNAELTLLFWRIGQRIHTEVLAGQRAGYGEEILSTLAEQLASDYGRGFGEKNLRRMVKFAATFPDEPIVATIELVAFRPAAGAQGADAAGLLRADGRHRTLERSDTARAHRLDAVRTHGFVQEAGHDDRAGAGDHARRAAHLAQPGHA